jgi:hypothetical protein
MHHIDEMDIQNGTPESNSSGQYGDSVTGDTPLLVCEGLRGAPRTTRIDALISGERWNESTRVDKDEVWLGAQELFVWSDAGFVPVRRIVRHFAEKPLVRVEDPSFGIVDCTEDHSLILSNGDAACPRDLVNTTACLARARVECDAFAHHPLSPKLAFVYGLFLIHGRARGTAWRLRCPSAAAADCAEAALEGWPDVRRDGHHCLTQRATNHDTSLAAAFRILFYNEHDEKRVPNVILHSSIITLRHFVHGLLNGETKHTGTLRVAVDSKESGLGVWIVGRRLGYVPTVRTRNGKMQIWLHLARACPRVYSVRPLPTRRVLLYDLETEAQRFHVGPGELLAHNTDSAFVRLPASHRDANAEDLFRLGEAMAEQVTRDYRNEYLPPALRSTCAVTLEMEKYLKPLILYKKKRYVGISYEELGKTGKVLARGLELVRRDAIPLVKTCQSSVIDALLTKECARTAVETVKAAVQEIAALPPGGPFTAITQSKSLRLNYASPDALPHVKVASLMQHRHAGSAPRVGDRVEYVVIASESPRVVDRVDDVGFAQRESLPPDWYFYTEAIERPLLRVLEVPLRSINQDLYAELEAFFQQAKSQALAQRKKHSMVRHEAKWFLGHACKKGPPQHPGY